MRETLHIVKHYEAGTVHVEEREGGYLVSHYGLSRVHQQRTESLEGARFAARRMGRTWKYFTDWRASPFPTWLHALGFYDASWHNDMSARACLPLDNGRQVHVWCVYYDPTEREPGYPTYGVELVRGSDADGLTAHAYLLGTDDEREAERYVRDLVKVLTGNGGGR